MDRIIIIDDSVIRSELERFIIANRNHIRFNSDFDSLSLGSDPLLKEILSKYEDKYRIKIRSKDKLYFFRRNEIVRFEKQGEKARIILHDKKVIDLNESFESLANQLEDAPFARVHEHHLVNVYQIEKIPTISDPNLTTSDGIVIPVEQSRMSLLISMINRYII
jgi:DNA-binding LytR/AlgR family response regulator